MKTKQGLLRRLLFIYALFLAVLVAGALIIFGTGLSSVGKSMEFSQNMIERLTDGDKNTMIYGLYGVDLMYSEDLEPYTIDNNGYKTEAHARKLDMYVSYPVESIAKAMFKTVGGSTWVWVSGLFSTISYIWILVLMIKIMNSIRRSIRTDVIVDKSNARRTRIIAILIIINEIIEALLKYDINSKAAEILDKSQFVVNTSFSPNYWNIIIGVLIIFMAEIFAITHTISEEQKLTI